MRNVYGDVNNSDSTRLRLFFLLEKIIGDNSGRHYQELKRLFRVSREELDDYRLRKLKQLITFAYKHVEFYRNRFRSAGVSPDEIKQLSDIERFPITTKQDLQNHKNALISDCHRKTHLYEYSTGGSTGEPTKVYRTSEENDRFHASMLMLKYFIGFDPVCREIMISGSPFDNTNLLGLMGRRIKRKNWIIMKKISEQNLKNCINEIKRFRPAILRGYTNILLLLCSYLKDKPTDIPAPELVGNASETMWESDRETISATFGAPTHNFYITSDIGFIGVECAPGSGLHLNDSCLLVEVVNNGQSASTGVRGEILVTQLDNFAMPLIRCAVGDIGALTDNPCQCGRKGMRLEQLVGRTVDLLMDSDGRMITGDSFGLLFKDYDMIRRFQVEQFSPNEAVIRLDTSLKPNDKVINELRSKISNIFGRGIEFQIDTDTPLSLTPLNKLRRIIRRFPIKEIYQ